jgi:hypothetical protein
MLSRKASTATRREISVMVACLAIALAGFALRIARVAGDLGSIIAFASLGANSVVLLRSSLRLNRERSIQLEAAQSPLSTSSQPPLVEVP